PDDVDLAHLRLGAFVDLENDVDAVLLELDALRLNRGGEAALALVELDNARNVGTNLRTGEDLARPEADFRKDLVALDPPVALQDDTVDDRVFLDLDGHIAIVVADADVGEQLGRVK